MYVDLTHKLDQVLLHFTKSYIILHYRLKFIELKFIGPCILKKFALILHMYFIYISRYEVQKSKLFFMSD